ncbi:MAG: M23 family metallopeptidase [Syntrophomonadaceae bacterium]|nr:M23 family metallopeptidase [Syntrophomonadaceae bacterium]
MDRKTLSLVLIVVLVLGGCPGSVLAGWGQSGFRPSISNPADDRQVMKYLVNKGDTVGDVAIKTGSDVEAIMAMNNLKDNRLVVEGQYLSIPWERDGYYTVKAGDTFWDIAQNHKVDLSQLIAANSGKDPQRLAIGDSIKIPLTAAATAAGTSQPSRSVAGLFSWPVFGTISSHFGLRGKEFHHGLDVACPVNTPIRAAKAGRVTFAGTKTVYGRTVIISHGEGVETLYAHASKLLVKEGQDVMRGQVIALVGISGRTTGPHLHFEIKYDDKAVNPIKYLR